MFTASDFQSRELSSYATPSFPVRWKIKDLYFNDHICKPCIIYNIEIYFVLEEKYARVYLEPCKTSKMERFAKIVNC